MSYTSTILNDVDFTDFIPRIQTCRLRKLANWKVIDGTAPYWRWYVNGDSGSSLRWQGAEIPLEPGNYYLIPPMTRFDAGSTAEVRHFFIHFSLAYPYNDCRCGIRHHPLPPREGELFSRLFEHMSKGQTEKSRILPLMVLVYNALAEIPSKLWSGPIRDRRIHSVVSYMEQNDNRNITNAELAEVCHMSENGFIRLFSQEVKLSPHQFLQNLRLNRACDLLAQPSLAIDSIAEDCGFADRSHFSKAFKKHFNLSPGQFRSNLG